MQLALLLMSRPVAPLLAEMRSATKRKAERVTVLPRETSLCFALRCKIDWMSRSKACFPILFAARRTSSLAISPESAAANTSSIERSAPMVPEVVCDIGIQQGYQRW